MGDNPSKYAVSLDSFLWTDAETEEAIKKARENLANMTEDDLKRRDMSVVDKNTQ